MDKKLSVAFVWHMHQPSYKDDQTGDYIMPWVRLHSVKDYLDMLLILEQFPKIKQTFNLVPLLLDQLEDYAHNEAHDLHSRITVKSVHDLTDEEKAFIVDQFFDANFANIIEPNKHYKTLCEKKFHNISFSINDYTDQEFSDVMAWFNLAWFDPYWIENNDEIKKLIKKGTGYTLEDRKRIIEIQRNIMRQIIPTYRKFLEEGRIEISTSPYYHPVLPLLMDFESAKESMPDIHLPHNKSELKEDAKEQLVKSLDKFENIFGQRPIGIWPSEQCLSNEVLDLMTELDIKWTITDEGILSNSIQKEIVRDFRGMIQDPYDLCQTYRYNSSENKGINILFRDSVLANLVGFEYGNHDPIIAANDLYDRIKTIQSKLQASPDNNHIVTIALDGENCWESYTKDGRPFLLELYKLLSEDDFLEITTVKDYLKKVEYSKKIDNIVSGSWINRNFQLWMGDFTKNLAWEYLNQTKKDFNEFSQEPNCSEATIKAAREEIYLAEGSDWFWWYGEPNDSGHDDLFDELFRGHLKKIYELFNKPIPNYLQAPLEVFIGKPSSAPNGFFTPTLNGQDDSEKEWINAGCIEMPHGPMFKSNKLFDRILFGNDSDNLYFRFDVNEFHLEKSKSELYTNQIYIYFYTPITASHFSYMRIKSKGELTTRVTKHPYSHELEIPICQGQILSPVLSEAMESFLWKVNLNHNIGYKHSSALEIAVPFEDLGISTDEEVHFVFAMTKSNVLQEIVPQNKGLVISRP